MFWGCRWSTTRATSISLARRSAEVGTSDSGRCLKQLKPVSGHRVGQQTDQFPSSRLNSKSRIWRACKAQRKNSRRRLRTPPRAENRTMGAVRGETANGGGSHRGDLPYAVDARNTAVRGSEMI